MESRLSICYLVRLSLLTMTNPNQLCDVLLFVCSKMADETNLSSKLPVADRTREVWGRKLCWWCLSSGFRCARFCSASLIRFASYSPAPLFMRPRHFVRSCAICSNDCGMLKYVEGFEGVLVSLHLTTMGAFSYLVLHRGFSLANVVTWHVHLNCANFRRVCILCIPALFRTSVSGILSCHLIFRSFLRQLVWKWFSLLACRW